MFYVTVFNPPKTRQITLDEILAGVDNIGQLKYGGLTSTRTIRLNQMTDKLRALTNVDTMIGEMKAFNEKYSDLVNEKDLRKHYSTFQIKKRTNGWRRIDNPDAKIREAFDELLRILKGFMIADYHTTAFAYVNGRCAKHAVMRHQQNNSNWIAKFDFHGFFPSMTKEFIMSQLSVIYPFAQIIAIPTGRRELEKMIGLCLLDGGLPQGTPVSPWLTNVVMIPFDHMMSSTLRSFDGSGRGNKDRYVYTRYADDIDISCHVQFNYHIIEDLIVQTLKKIGAPFTLNTEKTHYGSKSGKNWMLGMMLNESNEITPGWENVKSFKMACGNYLKDKKAGREWSLEDLQQLQGLWAYYKHLNEDQMKKLMSGWNEKYKTNIMLEVKADIKRLSCPA